MRLYEPRFELRKSRGLQEGPAGYGPQASGAQHLRFGYLARLAQLVQWNRASSEAPAHPEMRRAQADAKYARESAIARTQLFRQLPR